MKEFITGLINTSMVAGVSIIVILFFFYFIGRNYSARCRKVVWILMAFCCLIPFRFPSGLLRYTVEIPDVVIRQAENPKTNYAESLVVQNNVEQAATYEHESAQVHSSFGVLKKEITTADIFFTIWICVSVAMSIYYMLGYWMLQKKIKRWGHDCEDAGTQKILIDESNQYKMKRVPKLCILQDSSVGPFSTGFLRNTIVLPSDIPSERDMRFIIKHEMLHCKNKDILLKLFFLFVNIIHWFNPLVWLLRKAVEQDIEISCDEAVILGANRTDREEYSDVIMSWVERGNYKWSAVSTGYVQGVKFIKRRFDSIINDRKRKRGILLIGITCAFILLMGSVIHVQSGEKIYGVSKVPILQGIEVRTDLDGDGGVERVLITDHAYGDDAHSQVCVIFKNSNNIATVNYPDYWSSYIVTGDLSGNGRADIVVNMISTGSTYGGGQFTVLHLETNEAGYPELVEYPNNFIKNDNLELKWVGWEEYTGDDIPNDEYSTAQPTSFSIENWDFAGMGATIIEKDGKTMLRLVAYVDPWTESAKCIDCSYTPDGWYIEDMQMIYDYWGGGWEEALLGDGF